MDTGSTSGGCLVAFFDERQEAERAVERLRAASVPETSIRLTEGAQDGTGQDDRGFFESLGDFFMPDEDRHTYAEGLSRGGYLVTVDGLRAEQESMAIDILDGSGAVNIDEREASWRSEGWSGSSSGHAGAGASAGLGSGRAEAGDSVPIVEEQLRVGKRDKSHGRVRLRSYVRERPVEEDVTLRDERVEIERRPVDRAAIEDDDFRDREVSAEEHTEEAVVSKEARVVEEVGLRKESDTRRETVSGTVRHTEVEVEDDRTPGGAGSTDDRR
ncbi:hypothetical protein BH23PSE1_BH23PSE1_11350 [soil metagenome]